MGKLKVYWFNWKHRKDNRDCCQYCAKEIYFSEITAMFYLRICDDCFGRKEPLITRIYEKIYVPIYKLKEKIKKLVKRMENKDNWETAGNYAEHIKSIIKYKKKEKRIWNRLKKWWKYKKRKTELVKQKPMTEKEWKIIKEFSEQIDHFLAYGDGSHE